MPKGQQARRALKPPRKNGEAHYSFVLAWMDEGGEAGGSPLGLQITSFLEFKGRISAPAAAAS